MKRFTLAATVLFLLSPLAFAIEPAGVPAAGVPAPAEEQPDSETLAQAPAPCVDAADPSLQSSSNDLFTPPFQLTAAGAACSATATCGNGSTLTCTGSGFCAAQDASCPSERGWVECNGNRQRCGLCPGTCTGNQHCPDTPGCTGKCKQGLCVYTCS